MGMIRKNGLILIGATALLFPMGYRMAAYCQLPDFEPGIVYHYQHNLSLDDVIFKKEGGSGVLTVHAKEMRPGHASMIFFKLGPASFLSLHKVIADYVTLNGEKWRFKAPFAKLTSTRIEFPGPTFIQDPTGRNFQHDDFKIEFSDGKIVFLGN